MKIVALQPLGIGQDVLNHYKESLQKAGHTFVLSDTIPSNENEVFERAKDADVLILVNYPLSASVIDQCNNLKMISIAFTGFDHVATDACKKKKIIVCNAAGYATDSVAELAFGLIIGVLRNVIPCNDVVRKQGTRQGLIGNELRRKTLGIVGTGAIGLRVAELGKAFGCRLLGYNRSEKLEAKTLGLTYVDLETLLKESDIISVHTPLNSETNNLIGAKEFALMKNTAIVIQTSRGGTINEQAFAEALNSEKIAGAGVDVFMQEPPIDKDNPLLHAKNTVLTPHVAFATKEALEKRAAIAFGNITSWLYGKILNRVV